MDRTDRIRNYLTQALELTSSCVVVMKYTQNEPVSRTKLEYISDNVKQLGMNLASLQGGFRLPKDYIHPEDRGGFIDAVSIASETHTDFNYRVRLVGDDGILRNVDIRSRYMDYDDDYYLIEYVFHEVVQETEVPKAKGEEEQDYGRMVTKDIFMDEELGDMFGSFARAYGLYSIVVDQDGHALLPPEGPDAYLGYYYDMFERPENTEFFDSIKRSSMMQDEAVFMEIGDGNPDSRISAVPLIVRGVYLATWILCAHDKSQAASLRIASREQYKLGELIASYIQRAVIADSRSEQEEKIEQRLEYELRQKQILYELQDIMRRDEGDPLYTILSRAAEILEVDYAFFICRNERPGRDSSEQAEKKVWYQGGQVPPVLDQLEVIYAGLGEVEKDLPASEGVVIDKTNMTNRMRVSIFQGIARAALAMPILVEGKKKGRLCFIESRKERQWTDSDVHFARLIGRMIGEVYERRNNISTQRMSRETMLGVLNELQIDVFIRDNETGRALYANDVMLKKMGPDFIGRDSRRIIPEGREDYESYPGAIHETTAPPQVVRKWRRYINEFEAIYDVTEIPFEWTDGRPATAVLLRIVEV